MAEELPTSIGVELEYAATDADKNQAICEAARELGFQLDYHDGYRHTPAQAKWDFKKDRSCGYEAASPVIRTRRELHEQLQIADVIQMAGGEVTPRCGVHVHLGMEHGQDVFERLLRLFICHERVFFTLVPEGRRVSYYCRPIPKDYVRGLYRSLVAVPDMAGYGPVPRESMASACNIWGTKHIWVNLAAYRRHQTMEIRILEGQLKAESIIGYILFLMQLVDSAKRGLDVGWRVAPVAMIQDAFTQLVVDGGFFSEDADQDLAGPGFDWASGRLCQLNANLAAPTMEISPLVGFDIGQIVETLDASVPAEGEEVWDDHPESHQPRPVTVGYIDESAGGFWEPIVGGVSSGSWIHIDTTSSTVIPTSDSINSIITNMGLSQATSA